MKSDKIILGLLAGVAVGALAGILLAPDKGSVTRKNISKRSTGYADKLEALFNDFVEDCSAKLGLMKHDPAAMPGNGKTKQDDLSMDISSDVKKR